MRRYAHKRYSAAQLDAMAEGRAAKRMDRPERPAIPARSTGVLVLDVNGQRFDLELRPHPRDCRRWLAYRDGKPFESGGLERIWRKVQAELVPLLGVRNLQD